MDKEVLQQIRAAIDDGSVDRFAALIGADGERLKWTTTFGTWLHVAASSGKLDIAKWLVENGADINARGGISGGTPLSRAAAKGRLGVAEYLIRRGCELDTSEPEKNPLFSAIYGGHKSVVQALIDAGIDITVSYSGPSMKDMDALKFARERGQREIAELLIAAGAAGDSSGSGRQQPKDEIIQHMARVFGPVHALGLQEILPTSGVRVNLIPSSAADKPIIFFTTGVSAAHSASASAQSQSPTLELLIRLPATWPVDLQQLALPVNYWPIKLLKDLIGKVRDLSEPIRDGLMLFSHGVPLGPGLKFTCSMLVREPPGVSPVVKKDGREIELFAAVPLYPEEESFGLKHGFGTLHSRLQACGALRGIEINRASIVPG